jgi:hypothetical protein
LRYGQQSSKPKQKKIKEVAMMKELRSSTGQNRRKRTMRMKRTMILMMTMTTIMRMKQIMRMRRMMMRLRCRL